MQTRTSIPHRTDPSPGTYRRRVLFVDGDQKTQAAIERLVKACCADTELIAVENGAEAMSRLKSEPFDLVIVDPWASEVTGFEICRYVAQNRPEVLVFVYAKQALMNDRKFAEAAGAAAFFLRSSDQEFAAALSRALNKV